MDCGYCRGSTVRWSPLGPYSYLNQYDCLVKNKQFPSLEVQMCQIMTGLLCLFSLSFSYPLFNSNPHFHCFLYPGGQTRLCCVSHVHLISVGSDGAKAPTHRRSGGGGGHNGDGENKSITDTKMIYALTDTTGWNVVVWSIVVIKNHITCTEHQRAAELSQTLWNLIWALWWTW